MFELVAVLVLGVVVAAPVLAVIAFVRTRRLEQLEARLGRVERELTQLHDSSASAPTSPAATPRPFKAGEQRAASVPHATAEATAPPDLHPAGPALRSSTPVPKAPAPAVTVPGSTESAQPAASAGEEAPRSADAERGRGRIEWERWLGVRGAALLSGIAIAIAGILFFRHAIEQDWITAPMRVALGCFAGVLAIGGADRLRLRAFRHAPGALAGAGVVMLYASVWAAHRRYELLPLWAAFPAMAAVTAASGWLSIRHASQVVAALGLLGGFATPLLLQSPEPSPLGLFGYVLLLDLGVLALARRMRWHVLPLLAVAGTALIQIVWFAGQLDASTLAVTLAALGVLGLVLGLATPSEGEEGRLALVSKAAALLLPFAFVLELSLRADLGRHLYPLALVAATLILGGCRASRTAGPAAGWLPAATAGAAVALVAAWASESSLAGGLAWELGLCAFGLALPFPALAQWHARRAGQKSEGESAYADSLALAGTVSAGGMLAVLMLSAAAGRASSPWPEVLGLVLAAALLHHAGRAPAYHLARLAAALGVGLGLALALQRPAFVQPPAVVNAWTAGAALLACAGLAHVAAFLDRGRTDPLARRAALQAAALLPLPPLLLLPFSGLYSQAAAVPALGAFLLLGLSTAVAASRLGEGGWLAAAAAFTALAQTGWVHAEMQRSVADPAGRGGGLAIVIASAFAFAAWPALRRARLASSPAAWRAAALALLCWFPGTRVLFEQRVGKSWILAFAVLFAAAAALLLRHVAYRATAGERERAARRTAIVWLSATAVLFAAAGLPLQFGHYETRVTAALFGAGVLLVWRRIDHAGLQLWGVGALWLSAGAIFLALLPPPTYASARVPLFNWMSYAHLVPAAALALGAVLLRPLEFARARPFQEPLYRHGEPLLSSISGILAAAAVFVWINLSLFDLFGRDERIVIDFARHERRDLAISIAWALYGLALLVLGMARRLSGLRWMSLAFLVLALGKVFLRDLGRLEGLYRVFSLLGLGLSLLLVSLLYQRYVFPRRAQEIGGPEDGTAAPTLE